jgi:hypothetical protein
VRFPHDDESDEEIDTVLQPDLVVISDPDKLDEAGARGAPDWVVEILSPSTTSRPCRVDPVQAPGAVALVDDQAGVLEHAQVLRHGGPADGQMPGDVADGQGTVGDQLDDRSPGRVAQGVEDRAVQSGVVSRHLP